MGMLMILPRDIPKPCSMVKVLQGPAVPAAMADQADKASLVEPEGPAVQVAAAVLPVDQAVEMAPALPATVVDPGPAADPAVRVIPEDPVVQAVAVEPAARVANIRIVSRNNI